MKLRIRLLSLILGVTILFSLQPDNVTAAYLKISSINDTKATAYVKQSYSLPKTVKAFMSNKTSQNVAVSWNPKTANTSKAGTFVFKGTVKGYTKQILLTLKVIPSPIYSDPELARAVELGIGSYAKNTTVTYKQFFTMLDNVAKLSDSKVYKVWVNKYPKARASDNKMKREEGMLATYLLAEEFGPDYYNASDTLWWKINEKIGPDKEGLTWDYPLLPGWDEPNKSWGDNGVWNKVVAGYFFSMGKASKYNEATIFDYDSQGNSMRIKEPFTYEEALRAAVRLYYSGMKVTDRIVSEEDRKILKQADQRRDSILNSKTAVKITGTTYYISNFGNDNNDGLTPDTAWATIAKANSMEFKPGDGIFFERGGLWREIPRYRTDITYSAYGEGPKPKIYGSPENGADPNKWTLLKGTKDIWVFYKDMYDTSCIVFEDGKSWATRKNAFWDGDRYVELLDTSKPIDLKELNNLYFFNYIDYAGLSSKEAKIGLDRKGKLYLRCDAGNPGSVYNSIEFMSNPMLNENGGDFALIRVGSNSVVDNICVKYGNQLGISISGDGSVSSDNVIVQNCEVSWVGGCVLMFNASEFLNVDKNAAVRGGDGITIYNGSNNSVIDNYVHHVYDNGLTEETGPWYDDDKRYARGNIYKANLVEYCSGGLLIADWASVHTENYTKPLYSDFTIEDNYFMYTGYGWSHNEPNEDWGNIGSEPNNGNCSINFAFPPKTCSNINVINNVFYLSEYALVKGEELIIPDKNIPLNYDINFSGNTYVQNSFGLLARWGIAEDESTRKYTYNSYALETVTEVLGDKKGVVLPLDK